MQKKRTRVFGAPEPEKPLHPTTSAETIARVRKISGSSCLLSFSRGKDSVAAYLAVREHFDEVVPYFYEVVPNLEFVNDSLAYFEQKIGRHILRYPAPGFYRLLNNLVYQPPDHVQAIESFELEQYSHDEMQRAACEDSGLDYGVVYNAAGMRAKDSMQRALYFQKNGSINMNRRMFYPVWDWSKDRVMSAIRSSGWKLPIDYCYFPASFDGLYSRFLYPIKRYFPRDWERILTYFPLAELDVLRYESAIAAGEQPPYEPPPNASVYVPRNYTTGEAV